MTTAVREAHEPLTAAVERDLIEMRRIPLEQIQESPFNPRKHYAPAALEELKDSLLSSGQLTPIIVRPVAAKKGQSGGYELAAGHRRYRAAKLALEKHPEGARFRGLDHLLALVRELDDKTFLEILTIENLQRDDLHPLEEAQGFADLIKHAGYDVAKIAARIGRSVNYVYDRVKLLQLIPEAKKLFSAGAMEAGHAILLARLTTEQQKQALGDVEEAAMGSCGESLLFEPQHGGDTEDLELHDQVKPVSVREFQAAIEHSIRAVPERVDPFLFPESAQALEAAKEEKLSVIHITHDHRVSDDARDEKVRTFGERSWEFADGEVHEERWSGKKTKSKTCAFSRYGFVVAGADQGQVFRVCINKEKCHVHWPDQAKAAERRKKAVKKDVKAGGSKNQEKAAEKEKREEQELAEKLKQEQAERARWKKAVPELMEALATAVGKLSAKARAEILIGFVEPEVWQGFPRQLAKHMPTGDALASAVFLILTRDMGEWSLDEEVATALRDVGVKDAAAVARAIVDKVVPPVAKTKTPDARKPAKSPKAKKKST